MKYTKKPVTIEAVQWKATNESWNEINSMGCPNKPGEMGSESFIIPTLEGDMKVSKNDWVIKGVKGEFYPCKPDIFEATYSSESTAPVEGEWVRVEDRLPPFNENVIGYTKNGRKVMTFVDGSGKLDDQDIDENDCWTHWHKLPSPPNNSNGG